MFKMNRFLLVLMQILFFGFVTLTAISEESEIVLDKAPIDVSDLASLQRGAKLFMNYCSGCHSLKYIRYSTLAEDIGIKDPSGNILEKVVKDNLMFVGSKITDTIKSSMTKESGAAWFGVPPPDLSLVARSRGVDWLYTYLRSFYPDNKRPWGVNNKIFKDVAMPDVLLNLRIRLKAEEDGSKKYDVAIADLVNFLGFVGEPMQLKRKQLGLWVLLFLGIFFVFACLLKREYWKDVHS